ncbi:TetR/AcrR family transcriptional regulator [Nocardia cyriacigeorgica]|uniref:TetR/AcrR family transcriptional regulator n=1 Tax=Nocardia cyriacigeorgica TaxID=135487 RepID=UPI001895F4AF|nr:TetR/AcrR family transcriptional regulator [Nocardia cyriacigeorgica]MBF6085679.1 TetR/AcrR family transcriptional regulator [Nocardia cyriacigeorgica]MBF6091769.1 TetR/AcrR family transcriptional regulator [Nocardia cyriacigeorgica]MBF6394595.1 TetR/AcrR family transcriptional regulator [Nocardia cyriacigeorgica]MBF6400230.1 TetR/AcrR family transcriptional regulator [Nocardia cyriacigeorgica]
MPKTSDAAAQKGLPGRKAQAARNDGIILDAARAVFLADAAAPISAVAERAGVGISALYRRYPSKDVLLRTLCYDGLRRYNAEAEAALADSDPWRGLVGFLERVVDADVHSLTVRLAGTFTPDDSIVPDVQRSGELTSELVRRAHATGRLRPEVTDLDLGMVLDACAAVSTPDPERTAQLRRRVLALLVDGMAAAGELPGPAPQPGEFAWRWQPRTGR